MLVASAPTRRSYGQARTCGSRRRSFRVTAGFSKLGEWIRELAASFDVVELVHDPWRAQQLALELERHGMCVVAFPQSNRRLIPASSRLYQAVSEGRLTHGNDPALNRHVAGA